MNTVHIYTAGSYSEAYSGYGVFTEDMPLLCAVGPASNATDSFMAELKGIQTVLTRLINWDTCPELVVFHTFTQNSIFGGQRGYSTPARIVLANVKRHIELCAIRNIAVKIVYQNETSNAHASSAAAWLAHARRRPLPERRNGDIAEIMMMYQIVRGFNQHTNGVWENDAMEYALLRAIKIGMFTQNSKQGQQRLQGKQGKQKTHTRAYGKSQSSNTKTKNIKPKETKGEERKCEERKGEQRKGEELKYDELKGEERKSEELQSNQIRCEELY